MRLLRREELSLEPIEVHLNRGTWTPILLLSTEASMVQRPSVDLSFHQTRPREVKGHLELLLCSQTRSREVKSHLELPPCFQEIGTLGITQQELLLTLIEWDLSRNWK